jgi:hypothetical protein
MAAQETTPEEEVEEFAEQLTEAAARWFNSEHHDKRHVVGAVRYLAHVHAIPPIGRNVNWFIDSMCVLMELVNPNGDVPPAARKFLEDVHEAVGDWLEGEGETQS